MNYFVDAFEVGAMEFIDVLDVILNSPSNPAFYCGVVSSAVACFLIILLKNFLLYISRTFSLKINWSLGKKKVGGMWIGSFPEGESSEEHIHICQLGKYIWGTFTADYSSHGRTIDKFYFKGKISNKYMLGETKSKTGDYSVWMLKLSESSDYREAEGFLLGTSHGDGDIFSSKYKIKFGLSR